MSADHKTGRLQSGWVNRLVNSRFNYWFGFTLDFLTVLFFVLWDAAVQQRSLAAVALWVIAGFVLWGPSEYALHRWLYHRAPLMKDGHDIHHHAPDDLVGMPWFVTTGVMTSVWFLLSCWLGITFAASALAGWYAGFFYYSLIHHGMHHSKFDSAWMRKLKAHHTIHHHYENRNFGVTTRVWDRVFGTMFEREPRGRRGVMAVERA